MNSYKKGWRAENLAVVILWIKGYKIMTRRFRSPAGEIDVIARRGNRFVFIEVKQRSSQEAALSAISNRQQQRIRRATEFYFLKYPRLKASEIRFDVMAFWPWKWCHLKNVW